MAVKYNTIWLILIFFLAGCEEQIDWQLQSNTSDLVVVEAVLTNERINHLIRLTKPYSTQNQTPVPISGAIVRIITSDGNIVATEDPLGSGLYYTDSIRTVSGKIYTLTIRTNGNTYFASAIQPSGEPLKPISYSEVSEGIYTLNFNSSGVDPNYIKYHLDWQSVDGCSTDGDCLAKLIYYDLKNVDVHEQFKPDQQRVDFPVGTTVIRRRYSVSNNYREYLRGMLSETVWRGGVFDIFPANAATNLSEGAVGFFAVSRVEMDTTIITDLP